MGDLERFMAKTRRDPETGCLLWTAGHTRGYGRFKTRDGKKWGAHRWIFQYMYGYLPEVVMHRCDTPACVDWERCLQPGTHALNQADKARKGRSAKGEGNGKATLADTQAREIYDEYQNGILTIRMLAEAYGCGSSTVCRIVRGEERFEGINGKR